MNFRCKKKKEKKLSWKRLSKKEGTLSGSCSTMHARWREKFLDEIVCLGRTPSYGVNNIRNKLFLFLVERWIYLRRLCFFDEGWTVVSVFLRSAERKGDFFYFSTSIIFFWIIWKYMCVYIFVCMPLQFLGLFYCIFKIKIWKEYELYEANMLESSKEVSEIVSPLFFMRLPFQFLGTLFVTSPRYCQDMSHLNVT